MPRGFQDVHLEIHSSIEALDLVQAVTEQIARRVGLDENSLDSIVMAVRETVINAIIHGNKGDPVKLVFIDFTATPETEPTDLIVRVRDQGPGFDPGQLNDPLAAENLLRPGGRGIFLIRQFMDDVKMERSLEGGMEVRMLKHIHAR